jgi:hypothetical protein
VPNNVATAVDTSSKAAGNSCVVDAAAAALAALIADPIPVKFEDPEAKTSGPTVRYGDVGGINRSYISRPRLAPRTVFARAAPAASD